MTTPVTRPAERYGDKPGRRRWAVIALAVAGVALVAVAVAFILNAAESQIRASVLSWDKPAGESIAATVEVIRPPDTVVHCDVVAMDIRQIIVGQEQLVVPASPERRTVLDIDVPLQGEAVAVSVQDCQPAQGR